MYKDITDPCLSCESEECFSCDAWQNSFADFADCFADFFSDCNCELDEARMDSAENLDWMTIS